MAVADGATTPETIEEYLVRLRAEWRVARADERGRIERDAHYGTVLKGLLS